MIVLRLWAAMRQPRYYKHPVFRRILLRPDHNLPLNPRIIIGGGMILGLVLLFSLSYVVPARLLGPFALLPLAFPVLLGAATLGGTGRGLRLASEISAATSQEHQGDTFTVLASLPGGKLGVHWLILTAHIHRNGDLENTNEFQQQITGFAFWSVSFVLLIFYLNTWTAAASRAFVNATFLLYALVAIYYIDYVCSLVTGALVGTLTAAYNHHPRDARLIAVAMFLTLQGAVFAATYGVAMSLLPQLVAWLGFNAWLARTTITGLSLLSYYLLREALAWGLWRVLVWRLEAAPTEQEMVMRL
jgi:hypothetical protein